MHSLPKLCYTMNACADEFGVMVRLLIELLKKLRYDVSNEKSNPNYGAVMNEKPMDRTGIQEQSNENTIIFQLAANVPESIGCIKQTKMSDGLFQIFNVSPSLGRTQRRLDFRPGALHRFVSAAEHCAVKSRGAC